MAAPTLFSVDAPAKINLWLRVLGRREDGFHEVQTRMAPLDLCDRLSLTPQPEWGPGKIEFT